MERTEQMYTLHTQLDFSKVKVGGPHRPLTCPQARLCMRSGVTAPRRAGWREASGGATPLPASEARGRASASISPGLFPPESVPLGLRSQLHRTLACGGSPSGRCPHPQSCRGSGQTLGLVSGSQWQAQSQGSAWAQAPCQLC